MGIVVAGVGDVAEAVGSRAGATPADEVIREHYRSQAADHELAPTSTMADLTTRRIEVATIVACVTHALGDAPSGGRLLEVGCGNGYLLAELRGLFPDVELSGLDFSPDMVALATSRGIERCSVEEGDVRGLRWDDGTFDVVVSERCVINLLDADDQDRALLELHRVLRPGGHLVLVEAFTDGATNLNRARTELGLEPNEPPHHNLWMDKARVLALLDGRFERVVDDELPPENFLSSHYFISRVLYPAVTRREVLYNTEFVEFFRFLPPIGLYAPIQLLLLRKRPGHAR